MESLEAETKILSNESGIPDPELFKLERGLIEEDPLLLVKKGYLRIKTKEGTLVKLIPNYAQEHFLSEFRRVWDEKKPIRIIVLKARQVGISTIVEAILYALTSQLPNINSTIIADDDKGANYLFSMNEIFQSNLIRDYPHLSNGLKRSNEKKIEFDGKLSQIIPDTASNQDAGRKYTFRIVHLSEVSIFPNAEVLMSGLSQSVPAQERTVIVMESSARGQGNYFHNEWRKAERSVGKPEHEKESNWVPIFVAWYWDAGYRMPLSQSESVFQASLDNEEILLAKQIGNEFKKLSLKEIYEKLNWRRWTIKNSCQGNSATFRQEYPSNPEEAFLGSGRQVFPREITDVHKRSVRPVQFRGFLKDMGHEVRFHDDAGGALKIWHMPKPGHDYVIGADVAEGWADGNFSVADVFDLYDREQVAQWRGHVPPDEFGDCLMAMGYLWNRALLAPEANNHGGMVVMKLRDGLYPRIYKRQRYDRATQKELDVLGWRTDFQTRPMMIAYLNESLRNFEIKINSKETIEELETFIQRDDGSMGAESGKDIFDDRVISIGICNFLMKFLPLSRKTVDHDEAAWRNRYGNKTAPKEGRRLARKTGY